MIENDRSRQPILPGGTVTFLFTDIEGSTSLLANLRDQYATLLASHHKIIRHTIEKWSGREVDTQGDAFFVAFPKATEAVAAVVEIQRAIDVQVWPEGVQVKVRMGLHTGEPWLVEEGYVGMDVHRAARICHVGHGGQVLLSETTSALVQDEMPMDVTLLDLGRHRLKDMRRPERIHQLVMDGLPSDFPILKSLEVIAPKQQAPEVVPERETREVGPSPYRGLAAFQEGDADLFFGREAFTEQLATAVRDRGLVAVIVGPSGSGKSSTVFAGLLPRLRDDSRWLIVETRPGSRPFYTLASAFLPTLEEGLGETEALIETRRLAEAIRAGELGLFQVVTRALERLPDAKRLLLVIDQFEELFTLRPDPESQVVYLDELLAAAETAASDRRSSLVLLLTLRADFMGQALTHREFADALQDGSLILGPMNRQELQAAVEKPAELQGATFEAGLVQRILDDVGQEPGNLPLLEFALTLLWERIEDGWLTHAAYEAIGRVDGALARYAEEVYEDLKEEEKEFARRFFVQLVQPGEGTEDTRRVARRTEMAPELWPLVQHLSNRRLVVTGQDESGEETVEVVHEALIRGWERLRSWMQENRAFRTWQEGLRVAMRSWEASGQDKGALLRGAPLAMALEWASEHENQMSSAELVYIGDSEQEGLRLESEEEARRQRELEMARQLADAEKARAEEQTNAAARLRRRAFLLTGALFISGILAIAAFFFAQQSDRNAEEAAAEASQRATAQVIAEEQRNFAQEQREVALAEADSRATAESIALAAQASSVAEAEQRATAEAVAIQEKQAAEEQAQIATSRELAAASLNNLSVDPERSILLAMHGLSTRYTSEAEGALHSALQASPIRRTLIKEEYGSIWVEVSPDNRQLFVSGQGGGSMWDLEKGEVLFTIEVTENSWINHAAFTPDGSYLFAPGETWDTVDDASKPSPITVVDAKTGEEIVEFIAHDDYIQELAISPDGSLFATVSGDLTTKIWDLKATLAEGAGHLLHTFCCQEDGYNYVEFSPDSTRLVVTQGGDLDQGFAKVWDVVSGEELLTIGPGIGSVVYSPDGIYLVGLNLNQDLITVWDANSGELISTSTSDDNSIAVDINFSPDGNRIVTGKLSGKIGIWDFSPEGLQKVQTLLGHRDQVDAVFSSDGNHVYSSSQDGMIRIWDVSIAAGGEAGAMEGMIQGVSPNDEFLAASGGDGLVRFLESDNWEEAFSPQDLDDGVTVIGISPDGKQAAIGKADGTVTLKEIDSWRTVWVREAHEAQESGFFRGVMTLSFNPDGTKLATGGVDGVVSVWDVESGEELLKLSGHTGWVTNTIFSPDSYLLVTSSTTGDSSVNIWDASTGTILRNISPDNWRSDNTGIWGLDISPNGTLLSIGRADRTVELWQLPASPWEPGLDDASMLYEIQSEAGFILSMAFYPNGEKFGIAGLENVVEIRDSESGELHQKFQLPSGVRTFQFSSDGKRLITNSFDGIIRVFILDVDELLALARSRVTRSLTDDECRQYLHTESCP